MEARELRLGNWVQPLVNGIEVDYGHVVDTTTLMIINGDVPQRSDAIITYKPIPLTAEWLVRMGFNPEYEPKGKKRLMGYYLTTSTEACIDMINDSFRLAYIAPEHFPEPINIKVQHVHQLQNLYFALTGQELQVNPPAQ